MKRRLEEILKQVHARTLTPDKALELLKDYPYCELDFAKVDHHREVAKGAPEIVFGLGKTPAQIAGISREILKKGSNLLVTRVEPAVWAKIRAKLPGAAYNLTARTVSLTKAAPPPGRGTIVVLTAGTSDIPVAEEAALVATHMGCRVERGYDVGVAGLHRLVEPLTRIMEAGADVLVVVAGMEGALPSVVAGLVDVPVIGVPTSTGYGIGGDGTSALCSILQSCSPGLVAVNIDNGVGAGAAAALIARRRPL